MTTNYTTPGVYVNEIASLAGSVAQVATAIPAFIGYTQKAIDSDGITFLTDIPKKINSMVDFQQYFGGPAPLKSLSVQTDQNNQITSTQAELNYFLYDSLRLYFANGGGTCYIVSIGGFEPDNTPSSDVPQSLKDQINNLDFTLIVYPDAAAVSDTSLFYQNSLFELGGEQNSKFTIIDVPLDTHLDDSDGSLTNFKTKLGTNNLAYGASYSPWLQATLSRKLTYADLAATENGQKVITQITQSLDNISLPDDVSPAVIQLMLDAISVVNSIKQIASDLIKNIKSTKLLEDIKKLIADYLKTIKDESIPDISGINLADNFNSLRSTITPGAKKSITSSDVQDFIKACNQLSSLIKQASDQIETKLEQNSPKYKNLVNSFYNTPITLPPSGTIAGIYAAVDASRGVWKAPANVSLNQVIGVNQNINDSLQGTLNVDPDTGKSINAIRQFPGQGILVWGARTLAGNDNEWRYVSVRRLCIMIEESIKESMNQYVFEPNVSTTWLKVQSQIEGFLENVWKDGGLAGTKAEDAFFVQVGLNITMTAQDIEEGRMIVNVGVAPSRPAEFIVLNFSQMVQTS